MKFPAALPGDVHFIDEGYVLARKNKLGDVKG
jgi:hypothetical protein